MAPAGADPRPRRPLLARLDDGRLIRAAFFAMLAGTLAVLAIDYMELSGADALPILPQGPILPNALPGAPGMAPDQRVTTAPDVLNAPLTVELLPGGVLDLTGTIDVGAAQRVADELAARGEYVQVANLNSPGGSVTDALAISKLLRQNEVMTQVMAGSLCASSCPIVLAGGTARLVSDQAAVGVHQVYAFEPASATGMSVARASGQAMSDAQTVTAAVTRHMEAMGIKSGVWIHAMETPPDKLYYFTAAELEEFDLATSIGDDIARMNQPEPVQAQGR